MNETVRVGIVAAVAFLAACGGGGEPQTSTSPAPAAGPGTAAPPRLAQAPATPARDVSTLRACEIVTPAEAAAIVGGTLLNEPPPGFANCAYVVEANGATESYRLVLSEPGLYTSLLDVQGEAEKGERVAGLWDEAYVQPRSAGTGVSVIVVKRGSLALEVSGERRDPALAIARLAVSRVE